MEEKEKAVGANAKNAKGDANANNANAKGDAQNPNAKKNEKEKKKKAGIIIGVVGLSVAAAIAAAAGAKGCAPNERSYTVTYLTDDEVKNFQGGSVNVKEGTSIGDLKRQLAPLDGYEVEGFYKDPDCTLEFKDDDKITGDEKIYIQYKEIEITLIFHNDNNPNDNSFENMMVKYFDNLSKLTMPAPESYTSSEGSYTFKCWKTRDGKVVDLKEMLSGKDLLAIDADGEIDLYAEFDFEAVKTYSLNFDSSKVRITKDGAELSPQDRVYADDELVVEGVADGDWICSISGVTGLEVVDGSMYKVTGDVEVTSGEVEHRYLIFTLKDDQTYEVIGMKEGADETNIVIPDNHFDKKVISSIGNSAFSGKSTLTNVTLEKNITSIGEGAFQKCTGLIEVNYTGEIDDWASINFGDSSANPLRYAGQLKIKGQVQEDITINVPVKDYAFYKCTSIKNITFDEGCTSIGDDVFFICSELYKLTISNKLTVIGYAFQDCTKINEVNYLGTIDEWASINFEDWAGNPLYYTKQFKIKGQVQEDLIINVPVKKYAFPCWYNYNIKSVTIGIGCTSFGFSAFDAFGTESKFELNYLGTIDQWASIVVPNYLATPLYYAKTLKIKGQVQNSVTINVPIEARAFYGCTSIKSLTIGEKCTRIGNEAFKLSGVTSVNYTGTINQWASIEFGDYSANPLRYAKQLKINDVLQEDITINVPVKDYAFYRCTSIENITLDENCTSVGEQAFYDGHVTNLIISKNCTNMGEKAFFDHNVYLGIKVTYKGTAKEWINNQLSKAFDESFNLTTNEGLLTEYTFNSDVPDYALAYVKSLTSVTFGEGCTSIGSYAFYKCSGLTSVTIGENVTSIGSGAFYNCSSLKKVYYKGDEAGWTTLKKSIGSDNTNLINAQVYYFVDSGEENPYKTNPEDTKLYWHYDEDGITPAIWTKENQ